MIRKSLIIKVKEVAESTEKVIWYLNEYGQAEEHPFEKFIKGLYLDFDIALPTLAAKDNKRLFLGLAIISSDYELKQGSVPGSYRFYIEGLDCHLDEIKDVAEFEAELFTVLINNYYKANENNEIQKLEKVISKITLEWNWTNFVKQEELISLINNYSLKETCKLAEITEDRIPII
ncbi:hypothetical protein LCGC14_2640410, partial [marine sediment metagenome]